MQELPPLDLENWIDALKRCRQLKCLKRAKQLHSCLSKLQLNTHPILVNYLIPTLVCCGGLSLARRVFDNTSISMLNLHTWNSIFIGYCQHREPQEALDLYPKMQEAALFVQPDRITYLTLLSACENLRGINEGQTLHAEIIQKGLEEETVNGSAMIGNTLLHMYCRIGWLPEAVKVFKLLHVRDVVSWNALIAGYCEQGLSEDARKSSCSMFSVGISPDSITYVCMLKACSFTEALDTVQEVHIEMTKRGLEKGLYAGNALVDAYARYNSLNEACQIFDSMPCRDVISWATMNRAYIDYGLGKDVGKLLEIMQLEGISPDSVTFICSLKACNTINSLQMGSKLHAEIIKRGFEEEVHVGNALVDMYCKCCSLADACKVMDRLQARDAISWSALIAGHVEIGLGEEACSVLEKMLVEGIPPDCFTLVCGLKASAALHALDRGQELYAEAIKRGMERDIYVGCTLVDLYAECNMLAEAHQVLVMLQMQDTILWNALISGYADHGWCEKVDECVEKMLQQSVPPDCVTFACRLKASATINSGRGIHCEVIKVGYEGEPLVACLLVYFYGECGLLAEACQVFHGLEYQDAALWNLLVAVFVELGLNEDIEDSNQRMELEGLSPDCNMFVSRLKFCSMTGALDTSRILYSDLIMRGFERESYVGSVLVDVYSKFGLLKEAHELLKTSVQDVYAWSALLAGYADCELSQEAGDCLHEMQLRGVSPDSVIFEFGLKACSRKRDIRRVREMHTETTKQGLEVELHVSNGLVDAYVECGIFEEAWQMFRKIPIRNLISWNAIMAGYTEYGLFEEALNCFQTILLEGTAPDSVTVTYILKACSKLRVLELGYKVHFETILRGFDHDPYIVSTLQAMYIECKSMSDASHVFHSMVTRDVVSWNVLIAAFTEHGLGEEVVNCFQELLPDQLSPHSVTFISGLKACGSVGALETGRELHNEATKRGLENEVEVANMLVVMYGECGLLNEAHHLFDELNGGSIVSWNAMIKMYGKHHEGCMAVECFKHMQKFNVRPNSVTFISLLAACRHSSLVMEGWKCFKLMTEDYGLEPTMDHYCCVVDLFARSGQIFEAVKFIAAMKCPPSDTILYSLLSACKIYGKVEEGHWCFQQLLELNLEDSSAYVQMAEIYANAGRWRDASRMERMRKSAKAKKKPGSAFMEVNKELHKFVVGAEQNIEMLEMLIMRLKREGFVPSLVLVMNSTVWQA